MLLNKEILTPALVGAFKEDRFTPEGIRSKFSVVVDDNGHECGPVSRKIYRCITNGDFIAAADLKSDDLQVDLTATHAEYRTGKFRATLCMDESFKVPGDPSDLLPEIVLGNGYTGAASLTGTAGVYRLICTNGLSIGQIIKKDYQRHAGDFDLMEFVGGLLESVISRANQYKVTAELAAQTSFEFRNKVTEQEKKNRTVLNLIAETTPKRYHERLRGAILSNTKDMGDTAWAIVQAIAEVATHDMPGWNAPGWQRTQTNRVLQHVGIAV